MRITFLDFTKLFLRFINRNPRYYGTVTVKFYNGSITHLVAEDSYDVKLMSEDFITLNGEEKMFIKKGAPNQTDKDSSKMISTVEVDEKKQIVKESKLIKDEEKKEIVEEKEKN